LVLFRAPLKQRGRAILMDGPNMWIYIPGTNRPIRISPQQQLTGAASNSDVARIVFSLDYIAQKMEYRNMDNIPIIQLNLHAREKNAVYQQVNLLVEEKNLHPLKAEFFSLSGKLIRTIEYSGYKDVLGKQRPMTVTIFDAVKSGAKVVMHYYNMRIENTPPEYYQPSYLGRFAN